MGWLGSNSSELSANNLAGNNDFDKENYRSIWIKSVSCMLRMEIPREKLHYVMYIIECIWEMERCSLHFRDRITSWSWRCLLALNWTVSLGKFVSHEGHGSHLEKSLRDRERCLSWCTNWKGSFMMGMLIWNNRSHLDVLYRAKWKGFLIYHRCQSQVP